MPEQKGLLQPNGIDLARSIACFLVVLIHVAGIRFGEFGAGWWASNAFDSIARSSVTVFFMISGALLLVKNEEIGTFYKKRVLRILPPIFFWSVVYMLYFGVPGKGVFDSFLLIFNGPVITHLWYLYVVIGLTMFVPFLGMIYRSASETEKRIFIAIWFVVTSIYPVAWDILNIKTNPVQVYGLGPFTGFMGLFFLGAYIYEHRCIRGWKWLTANAVGFLATGLLIAALTFHYSVERKQPVELFYAYQSALVVIAASFIFNMAVCFPELKGVSAKAVRFISDCSLGIYCLHPLVLFLSTKVLGVQIAIGWLPVALTTLSVFLLTAAIIWIARLAPGMKHVA